VVQGGDPIVKRLAGRLVDQTLSLSRACQGPIILLGYCPYLLTLQVA
jgi:hypothetical protein